MQGIGQGFGGVGRLGLEHFNSRDYRCRCGCGLGRLDMRLETLGMVDRVRHVFGKPLTMTSAIRCEAHNRKVGGAPESSHRKGEAVDLKPMDGDMPGFIAAAILAELVKLGSMEMETALECMAALRERGHLRIGVGKTFLHLDTDTDKPAAVWTY